MNLVRWPASGAVLVAGTVARDTIARVEELPRPDEAVRAHSIVDAPGGCGANVARALGRLGHAPALLSAVGPDFEGSEAHAELVDAGVDDGHLVTDEALTARAVVATDGEGRQTIVYHEGATPAMRRLRPVEASIGHFAPGELTVYPDLMAACETVTYDPGQETFHRSIEEVIAPIEHADVLLANEHETERIADAYGGFGVLREALAAVVVSDREGQDVYADGRRMRVEAVEADFVDATGAGDAFSAGLVHGLDAGWKLVDACRFGSVIAGFAVEALGAQRGQPSLDEAMARFERAYGEPPEKAPGDGDSFII